MMGRLIIIIVVIVAVNVIHIVVAFIINNVVAVVDLNSTGVIDGFITKVVGPFAAIAIPLLCLVRNLFLIGAAKHATTATAIDNPADRFNVSRQSRAHASQLVAILAALARSS